MEMAVASLHPPKSWTESGIHIASIMDKKLVANKDSNNLRNMKKATKVAVEVREQYLNVKNNHLVHKISH